jgi:hypothetical protein
MVASTSAMAAPGAPKHTHRTQGNTVVWVEREKLDNGFEKLLCGK